MTWLGQRPCGAYQIHRSTCRPSRSPLSLSKRIWERSGSGSRRRHRGICRYCNDLETKIRSLCNITASHGREKILCWCWGLAADDIPKDVAFLFFLKLHGPGCLATMAAAVVVCHGSYVFVVVFFVSHPRLCLLYTNCDDRNCSAALVPIYPWKTDLPFQRGEVQRRFPRDFTFCRNPRGSIPNKYPVETTF